MLRNTYSTNGIGIQADTGGVATVTNTQSVGAVAITNNGKVVLPAGGPQNVLITTSLTISGGGKLDINDHGAIIDYSGSTPVQSVRGHLRTGYNGGAWNGPGIISSVAAVTPNQAIGYADNANAFASPRSTFLGQSVDPTSILISYTRMADADMDGDTDGVDIGKWATNFTGELGGGPTATHVWTQGDWDYDGDVDGVDAGLWAPAFTGELGGGGLGSVVVNDPTISPQAATILQGMGITVVPEPTLVGLAGMIGAAWSLQRPRSRRARQSHRSATRT